MPAPVDFFSAAAVAWSYFDTRTHQAIKTCCREGRVLFDTQWTNIHVVLGSPDWLPTGQDESPDVTAAELVAGLSASRQRGSKPLNIEVELHNLWAEPIVRQRQTVAVLTGVAGPTITTVTIGGYPSLSPDVAAALGPDTLPSLRDLTLWLGDQYDPARDDVDADAFTYGFMKLLWTVGPRLERFKLEYVDGEYALPSLALRALEACSRLQHLDLEAGVYGLWEDHVSTQDIEDQASLLAAVACLTSLRSLDLHGGRTFPAEDAKQQARRLRALSSLTGLTQLRLALTNCIHEDRNYSIYQFDEPPDEVDRQVRKAAWDRQRTCLLSAVARMPGLQRLCLDGMTLAPTHIAKLTTLTHLEIRGIELPTPASNAALLPSPALAPPTGTAQSGTSFTAARSLESSFWLTRAVPLPQQLRTIVLHAVPSPRHLAALSPPPGLRILRVEASGRTHPHSEGAFELSFQDCDVTPDVIPSTEAGWNCRQLMPDTPAVMAAAAEVLETCVFPSELGFRRRLAVSLGFRDVRTDRILLPPGGQPEGHTSWMRPLGRLRLRGLQLNGMALGAEDVRGMVPAFPGLTHLQLSYNTRLPPPALPLLGSLSALEELTLGMDTCQLQSSGREAAEAALLALFTGAAETRQSQLHQAETPAGAGGAGASAVPAGCPVTGLLVHIYDLEVPDWTAGMVEAIMEALAQSGLPGSLIVGREGTDG